MIRWVCDIHGNIDMPATLTGNEQACPICCTGVQLKRKPRVYKKDGVWWVDCKHGNRTGPYYEYKYALLATHLHGLKDRILKGAR
jgi:hypothetical protein